MRTKRAKSQKRKSDRFKSLQNVIMVLILCGLVGCAGFNAMTPEQKVDAIYFTADTALTVAEAGMGWVKIYFPNKTKQLAEADAYIKKAHAALDTLKVSIDLYKSGGLTWQGLLTHQEDVLKIIASINSLAEEIKK